MTITETSTALDTVVEPGDGALLTVPAGGRLQIGDILVQHPVPESARHQIDLWTG